jgi:uncharacterized protein (DUF486 family)
MQSLYIHVMDGNLNRITAATPQLKSLLNLYTTILPIKSFPYVPLVIAAFFQVFAWTSGSTMLSGLTLIPRVLVLWLFAAGEYTFMSPAMNAGVEVLGMSEPVMVVIYQVVTLVVFLIVNTLVYKNPFKLKYLISFMLLAAAIYIAWL